MVLPPLALIRALIASGLHRIRSETGAGIVETVIITAAFAALALAVMAAIKALVDGKVGSIRL